MLAWSARYDVPVTAPDGRELTWDDPEVPGVLEADLGWPVTLRHDVGGQQDLDETLLVTVESSLEAACSAPATRSSCCRAEAQPTPASARFICRVAQIHISPPIASEAANA